MPNILNDVRLRGMFNIQNKTTKLLNKYAQAFFKYVGQVYVPYPVERESYLDKAYAINGDVYSIIQQMATKTSSIPFKVKRVKDKVSNKRLGRLEMTTKGIYTPQQLIKRNKLSKKAFEEMELDFPMEKPNEMQTWTEIFALFKTFIRLTGEAYFYMMRPEDGPNSGTPLQVYILPSHLMNIVLKQDADMTGIESPIDYYKFIEGNQFVKFDAEDIIHVKLPNPNYDQNGSHLYGLSPLKAVLRNIQSSNEAVDNNNRTLKNSGAFGFIHAKGQPLTKEQADELKNRLKEMEADKSRLGQIAGASGELGFTKIGLNTDELKPFEFLKHDQKAIANALGWNDVLLNNDDSSKSHLNSINQAWQGVVINNIMPDLKLLEQAFNDRFLPLFKGYEGAVIQWDPSELPEMQQDMEKLVKWLSTAAHDGVINRNEYREALGFPKSNKSEMEAHTVGLNVQLLEDALIPQGELDEANNIINDPKPIS